MKQMRDIKRSRRRPYGNRKGAHLSTFCELVGAFLPARLKISNNPSTRYQSSLSGPPLVNLKTFSGFGVNVQAGVTVGMFLRF